MNTALHIVPLASDPNLTLDFTKTPWWLSLIKALVLVVLLILSVIMALWVERRGLGRMQTRPGPNVHGPFGLFQALGDAVKLLTKEDIWKAGVDRLLYYLGPTIAAFTAFMIYAVIPLGPQWKVGCDASGANCTIDTPLQLVDFPVSGLYILAIAGLGVYGIVLGGWSSNNSLGLLGATRSAAQVISYELGMSMALVSVFIMSGSMSTSEIVKAQADTGIWWAVTLFPAFVVYLISMIGEVNRLPFDMPECEGEIVAGHQTEYSSMKFGWFYLAEYVNMFNVSGVAITMFLGGWRIPFGDQIFGGMFHQGLWPLVWFGIKVWLMIFFMVWVRGTLVRVRYDQLMAIGWKGLMPIGLVWLVLVAAMRTISYWNLMDFTQMLIALSIVFVIALVIIWISGNRAERKARAKVEAREAALAAPFDAFAGGYPVPPLPGQTLPPSPRSGTYSEDDDEDLVAIGAKGDDATDKADDTDEGGDK